MENCLKTLDTFRIPTPEVFAADFRDRVVHHLFVREIEPAWERVFIHDAHACRRGHGTHAAVERAQTFTRRATANGTRRAWFLQLDIAAFFPSIDRHLLLEMLLPSGKRGTQKHFGKDFASRMLLK